MRKVPLLLLALLLGLPAQRSSSNTQQKPVVLTRVTVIDATGAPARPDITVVITGNRITAIGKDARQPSAARVIDATGKLLIPGLWDMHVHWYDPNSLALFTANG